MNHKRLRVIAIFALFLIICSPIITTATDLQQQLNTSKQNYNQVNQQLTAQRKQVSDATSKVEAIRQTIKNLQTAISAQKDSITKLEADLQRLNKQQTELSIQKENLVKELGVYLRANYEDGPLTYVDVILGSTSWNDLINKVEQVNYIVSRYGQLHEELLTVTADLESQKTAISKKTLELQNSLAELQNSQASINQSMQKEQDSLSKLSTQEKTILKSRNQAQAEVDYIQDQIRQEAILAELAKQQPMLGGGYGGNLTSPVKVSAQMAQILGYAQSFIGVPYRWGGTSPAGFDCSGFVQFVYAHFGVRLARISFDQYRQGMAVSAANLQPGDLVFFQTYAPGASHVGIYLGNDNMIDAGPNGIVVNRLFASQYNSSHYLGARRVVTQ